MARDFVTTLFVLSGGGTAMAALLWLLSRLAGQRLPSGFYYAMRLPVLLRFVIPAPGRLHLPGSEGPAVTALAEAPPQTWTAPRPYHA
ncbi:MAG: hypothetical protein IJ705_08275, partial [Oscillospiraceae bacterium]|nr:hypothetical protein [Oscillospiraceae bacterium]